MVLCCVLLCVCVMVVVQSPLTVTGESGNGEFDGAVMGAEEEANEERTRHRN